ncbi:hypothetical protein OROHE_020059 [Orobanche hederae]
MSSQEILKIRDGTPLEAEGILTYKKSPRNGSVLHFSSKLDVPSNVVQKKRVAQILVFKMRPSQEILKIRDGTPLEAEGILTYRKKALGIDRFGTFLAKILKIRDGTPLEAEGILTYKKALEMDRPSQEILKIRDGIPLEAEGILTYKKALEMDRVARILVLKIRPSQEILKIRDGTPLEAEGILTYKKALEMDRRKEFWHTEKSPLNGSVLHFYSNLDVPSNVVQNKRVARILVFKIRPSQEILKIRDGTPLEKRVARILVFKIRPSQEILKIRDGTPLEAEGILTYKKSPRNGSVLHFSSKLDVPSNVVQKKRVAQILVFKMRPSQEILKIRDGTPLEAEGILTYRKKALEIDRPSQEILKIRDGIPLEGEGILTYRKKILKFRDEILKIRDGIPLEGEGILTYRKSPQNGSVLHFSSKPSQEILKIRDGIPLEGEGILTYRKSPQNGSVWSSQEILKIRDGTPLEAEGILTYKKSPRNGSVLPFSSKLDVPSNVVQKKRVAQILVFKIRPSQEILKIRDGTPLEAEGILTYKKSPRKGLVLHFSSKLDVPSNVVQKKRVAQILVFKIRPSQEILKIRDGTPLEAEGILTYRKKALEIDRPSQEILKIRDGIPLEGEGILTYRKSPQNGSKRVARILVFKMRPSQEILKFRDGTPLEKRVARILVFKIRPSQEILKIRDGIPLEGEGILTYRKSPQNGSVSHFSSKLDVPSNVVQSKRVAWILVLKIRSSQEILKIRDGTPLEAEGILTYKKSPRNGSVLHFSSKLDVPSNVVQYKTVARILVLKIRPSQEILKIRDGTPLEAEGILTYKKALEMDRFGTFLAS